MEPTKYVTVRFYERNRGMASPSKVDRLERTLAEREGQLRECVELLEFLNSHFMGKIGSSVVPLAEMQALLARLKETL